MPQSAVTSKNQTTVPREIRERLGVASGDVLSWEIISGGARVTVAGSSFLARRGTVRVGPGSPVDDVERARLLRGTEPG